jgi:hypothetical protein
MKSFITKPLPCQYGKVLQQTNIVYELISFRPGYGKQITLILKR